MTAFDYSGWINYLSVKEYGPESSYIMIALWEHKKNIKKKNPNADAGVRRGGGLVFRKITSLQILEANTKQ